MERTLNISQLGCTFLGWFAGDDPVNKETTHWTNSLMSPPKVNLLLNFWGKAECSQKRNKSLLQVGLEPFNQRSSAILIGQNMYRSTSLTVSTHYGSESDIPAG